MFNAVYTFVTSWLNAVDAAEAASKGMTAGDGTRQEAREAALPSKQAVPSEPAVPSEAPEQSADRAAIPRHSYIAKVSKDLWTLFELLPRTYTGIPQSPHVLC
jgi:hypothetical protein